MEFIIIGIVSLILLGILKLVFGYKQKELENIGKEPENAGTIRQPENNKLVKQGFWNKFKAFWLQEIDWNKEIKVELTPYQQKVEDEINEFLHQEITWEKVHDFLFQEITFGKKKEQA